MKIKEVIKNLESLKEIMQDCQQEVVDDPEEIEVTLAMGASNYEKAIDYCLDILRGAKASRGKKL